MPDQQRTQRSRPREQDELVFLALGGLGEIGMNAYLYGIGPPDARRWLMVDLGITFPEGEDDPGVDVILPDLRFIEEERSTLAGIVITHAHEDHIGAVIDLWPRLGVPVYATPFTAGMLKAKLAEYGGRVPIPIREVPLNGRFEVGPFDVEMMEMSHSIPESSALAIRTPLGTVLHTGDWKLDLTPTIGGTPDAGRLTELGDEGVLALVGDSTNAMREGRSPSERDVAKSLADIIKQAPNRVAVTTFASNVARVKAVADAARAAGRELVIAGRALHRVIDVAIDTGYLPPGFRYVDQQQFSEFKRSAVVCLCTGSQGEPRAAMARIAENAHPDVSLDKGDLAIFSSRTIPGNEKAVGWIQNSLVRMGVEVLTDGEALVHVTGHPRRDELRQLYAWTRPKIAIPMHGEARHLKAHAELAKEAGVGAVQVAYNGEMVRLAPGPVRIVDDAPVGRLFRDGNLIVPSGDGPVRERRKLAAVGIVMVALALSRRGEVLGEPQIAIDGVPYEDTAGEPMEEIVLTALEGTLRSIPRDRRRDLEMVSEAVRRGVRSAVANAWGKKPIVKVLVNVVEGKG
jgi:ribonuclease J